MGNKTPWYDRVGQAIWDARCAIKEISKQPETKLIVKAAAKSVIGGAAIGTGAGLVFQNVPALAIVTGIGGSGLWGYHCGKELDQQLLELRLKQITENPQLMEQLQAMFEAQAQNPKPQGA